ncbi:DUF1249 domain-containing protein [Proteobacteria bacterium 005FR1]|nr:DUF1249 domain-containing protein [Proteobacteria bacterium 005FR1]
MSSAVKALFLKRRRRAESGSESEPAKAPREFRPLSEPAVVNGSHPAWQAPGRQPGRPRYRVDLSSQQADCEANYLRLKKILPGLESREEWLFDIGSSDVCGQMYINVVDRAPYTTTLQVTQPHQRSMLEEPGSAAAACLKAPCLTVCMYHDADMAEVVGWESHRRLQARYEYPNANMYHSDEKAQLNRFLADWLTLCQAEGRLVFDLAELGLYK